jgi:hypothetical protein
MKRKLAMDEVRVGMYITVLRGKMDQRVYPSPDGPKVQKKERDHYNGKILEVMNLDLPYIVVKCHEARGTRNDSLDLRHTEVMHLTPEYIANLLPDFKYNGKDPFWEDIPDNILEGTDVDIDEIFKDL